MTTLALQSAPYTNVLSKRVTSAARRLMDIPSNSVYAYAGAESSQRSILELEGMGREIWAGVDPTEYIKTLRDEWDNR